MRTSDKLAVKAILGRIKAESFTAGYKATDAEAMGLLIASYFEWNGVAILRTAEAALEDANFHTESGIVSELADKYDPPFDPDAPIDDDTRKALFAYLRGQFGSLSDADRLRKVSKFAGKEIHSMSRRGNMTMGDARRVFAVLEEL